VVQRLRLQIQKGTRPLTQISLIYSAFNKHTFGGVLAETILFIFLLYVPGVNNVFGGRPLNFFILGVPGLGFSMFLLLWEESRKALINYDSNNGKPNWWQRNLLW
jgi:sodium/potassium-transporting ATPase subunit alpha